MTCPICNQKIDPSDHSEKWGPEFAHSRCVIAFTAGSAIQDAKLQDRIKRLDEFVDQLTNSKFTRDDLPKESLLQRIKRLEREVELLRLYGNKDCTAQADEVLKKEAKP